MKSFFSTLALLAMAVSPIAAASSPKSGSIVARNGAHAARGVKASAALTKRANKEKRGAPRVKPGSTAAPAKAAGGSTKGMSKAKVANPYAKGSAFLSTKAALAAAGIRCNRNNGGDAKCGARTTPPADASAVCLAARCTFRCNAGFAPGGADGTTCVAAASACDGVTCPAVTDGFNTCSASGTCTPGCFAGTTLYQSGSTYRCFATTTDADNCSAPGQACPASYNGVGAPRCNNSRCSIVCPAGTSLRRAQSTTNPFTCY